MSTLCLRLVNPAGVETRKSQGSIKERVREKVKSVPDLRLDSLASELAAETGYELDRVIRKLMELEAEGTINLQERVSYATFSSYAVSPLALWFWGGFVATVLSLGLIGVTGGAMLYLRYVFGGLLVLYLPGFALIEFLYAKKAELDQLVRLALSIGLSLAVTPLIGLVLNYTPFGIRLIPVAVSLALFTIIFLFLSLKRKHSYYKLAKDIV